jgi:hypothetical protein
LGTLLIAAIAAAPAAAATDSAIAPARTLSLPGGHGEYFYVASGSGEQPLGGVSWLEGQNLAVQAPGTSNESISVGHASAATGSFASSASSIAIAGVGIDGYEVVQTFTGQASRKGHKATRTPTKPIRGASLSLPFNTTSTGELVLLVAGGQGTGTLALSGIEATTLQNATYGSNASLASAAAYLAAPAPGKHKAKWRTSTFAPNAGTSVGAVAYVLSPAPAPAVEALTPAEGPEAGGTHVTISGTNLDGASSVKFGETAASFIVVSPTAIEAVAPPGTGSVDVTVATERGASALASGDRFRYVAPPSVTAVSPARGPQSGGTAVTISGANLAGATAVQFGGSAAQSFKVLSPGTIEAVSPAGSGTVDVTVSGPFGSSTTGPADHFEYEAPPQPSISASKGGPFRGGFELSIQVHNFPLGTFVYQCHDNSGPGGSDTVFFSHAVEVTNPNQSSWPGVFCFDSAPFVAYLTMDGFRSNSVQF